MTSVPLVSCIMPTARRPHFVPRAVEFFLRQQYPNRELIVVDDGAQRVDHLIPNLPSIRYRRLETPLCLGEKRNIGCELAAGEIIAHWDDDDWIGPWRLTTQVNELEVRGADASGLSTLLYFDPVRRLAWRWQSTLMTWLAGGSLCYRKAIWSATPFRLLDSGEDTAFVHDAGPARFVDMADASFYVAVVHGANTSARPGTGSAWNAVDVSRVRHLMGADMERYYACSTS